MKTTFHPANARDNSPLEPFRKKGVGRRKGGAIKFSNGFKFALMQAHDFDCTYCGNQIRTFDDCHPDHVVPVSAGGTDDIENLALSCRSCNITKGDRSLEYLRAALALKNSPISEHITVKAMLALMSLGVEFPFEIDLPMHFERVILEKRTKDLAR